MPLLPTRRWWGLRWPKHNAGVVLSQKSGNRTFNTPTKIHLQPASFPFPSSRVQPYARIGPSPGTIAEIKMSAAMLSACSMIRADFWTVYWHTVTEPRGVYTCEMYQSILQIVKSICCRTKSSSQTILQARAMPRVYQVNHTAWDRK